MSTTQSGFSLIESLITTVVLSVGLLGLGQLHARLWLGSGELHTAETAALLGANLLEILPLEWLDDRNKRAAATTGEPLIRAEIRQSRPRSTDSALTTSRVELRWRSPSGRQSLSVQKTSVAEHQAGDTRWLLQQQ